MDVAEDIAWLTPGGWGRAVPLRHHYVVVQPRDLLDWMIRGRLSAQPGLRLHERVQVTSSVANATAHAFSGSRSAGTPVRTADLRTQRRRRGVGG